MDPLPQYATWWSITEQCSGLSGDMSAIQWYTVPGRGTLNDDNADGIYFIESHRIVLAGDSVSSGQLVRHEMLHALGATPGHPAQYFQDLCGGIVDCEEACIRSGGGAPPVDSLGPLVQPSEMTITATADPRVPLQ